jgi:hypothetical protein
MVNLFTPVQQLHKQIDVQGTELRTFITLHTQNILGSLEFEFVEYTLYS